MNDSLMSDDVIPKYYLLVITTIPCFLNRENRNLRVSCWILKIRAVLSVFWQLLINLNSWKWIKVRTGWVIVFGNSSPTFFLFIFWSFFVNLFSGTIQNLEIPSNITHPNFKKKIQKYFLRVVLNLHQLFSLRRLYLDQNPLQYFLFLSSFALSFVVL